MVPNESSGSTWPRVSASYWSVSATSGTVTAKACGCLHWTRPSTRYTCSTCPCSSYWGGSRSVGGAGSRRSWRARPRRCWCRITCSPCTSSPNRSRYCSCHPCARPSRRATTTVLRTSSSTCSSWATDCGSSWRSSWANA